MTTLLIILIVIYAIGLLASWFPLIRGILENVDFDPAEGAMWGFFFAIIWPIIVIGLSLKCFFGFFGKLAQRKIT